MLLLCKKVKPYKKPDGKLVILLCHRGAFILIRGSTRDLTHKGIYRSQNACGKALVFALHPSARAFSRRRRLS
jgi:hypothetical protein